MALQDRHSAGLMGRVSANSAGASSGTRSEGEGFRSWHAVDVRFEKSNSADVGRRSGVFGRRSYAGGSGNTGAINHQKSWELDMANSTDAKRFRTTRLGAKTSRARDLRLSSGITSMTTMNPIHHE